MGYEDHETDVIIAITAYGCLIVGTGIWAYFRERSQKKQEHTDEMTAHYLGGRSFGPIVIASTVFASLFSGYSIVGAPSEAFYKGWFSLTWLVSLIGIVAGYAATGPRLRRASELRNHTSPVDFITDRFQSQYCKFVMLFLQIIPTVMFLAGQIIASQWSLNQVFGLDDDDKTAATITVFIVLIFEWAGGLNSVALTDSIQGFVMLIAYFVIPIAITYHFGGWGSLDPKTYPRPDFYQTLDKEDQWEFWQFAVLNLAFFSLPPLIQRTYAASDIKSLKVAYGVLLFGSWMTQMVGIFMGTMAVQAMGPGVFPQSPYNAMLELMMDKGGISKIAAVVTVTASLAAVMSTADSLIIATSQLVTKELYIPAVGKTSRLATDHALGWVGRLVSLLTVIVALVMAFDWDIEVIDLIMIQISLSFMTCPGFIIGMYGKWNCHPWSIANGGLVSAIYIFAFHEAYVRENPDAKPINQGVSGVGINLVVIFFCEAIRIMFFPSPDPGEQSQSMSTSATRMNYNTEEELSEDNNSDGNSSNGETVLNHPNRPQWDVPDLSGFGKRSLTWQYLEASMEGSHEIMKNGYWVIFMLLMMSLATPLTPENEPAFGADGQFTSEPYTIGGIPWWAFKTIVIAAIPTVVLGYEITKLPDSFDDNFDPDNMHRAKFAKRESGADSFEDLKGGDVDMDENANRHMEKSNNQTVTHRTQPYAAHVSQTGDVKVLNKRNTQDTDDFDG